MDDRIAALLEERRGYETRGLTDRVAQVDAEIKRISGLVVETIADEDVPAEDVPAEDVPAEDAALQGEVETADATPASKRRRG